MNKHEIMAALNERHMTLTPQITQDWDEIPSDYDFPEGLILVTESNKVVLATEPPQFVNSYAINYMRAYNHEDIQVYTVAFLYKGDTHPITIERITVTEAETILLRAYNTYIANASNTAENQRLVRSQIKATRKDRYL
jgi:hypothetical protein